MTRIVESPRTEVLNGELVVRFDYEESAATQTMSTEDKHDKALNGVRPHSPQFTYMRGRFNFYTGKCVYTHDPNSSFVSVKPGEEPPPRKEIEERFGGTREIDYNWAHKVDRTVVVL